MKACTLLTHAGISHTHTHTFAHTYAGSPAVELLAMALNECIEHLMSVSEQSVGEEEGGWVVGSGRVGGELGKQAGD